MIRKARVQLLPSWDILDAMVFDAVRKEVNTMYGNEEEAIKA